MKAMKIYTRGGDKGTTALVGGHRISKADMRVEAYGEMDELMAHVGVLITSPEVEAYREVLTGIQLMLMVCSSHVATDTERVREKLPQVRAEDVAGLEAEIDRLSDALPPMEYFVLPGGHNFCVAQTHVARTVTRRVERAVIRVGDADLPATVLSYLNRLSDYFFALGRRLSHDLDDPQIEWRP